MHATPTTTLPRPLSTASLELLIAADEWRRSRTKPETIWTHSPLTVTLTTDRRLIAQLSALTLYDVQVRRREDYLEARRTAIAVAAALIPRVIERLALLVNYRYPVEREEVEAQARLFLMDWTTEIHELYERFDAVELALPLHSHERQICASVSQALANTIF